MVNNKKKTSSTFNVQVADFIRNHKKEGVAVEKLFADKSIPDVILTLLTIFILAPLNEETLFRGIMLNVFRSRYCWTMWLGALITSLLFVAAHSQYQNLLTLAELFLVGLITSVARIRSGGLLLPVLLHMEATTLGLLFG